MAACAPAAAAAALAAFLAGWLKPLRLRTPLCMFCTVCVTRLATGATFAKHRQVGDMIDAAKDMLSKERNRLEDRFHVKKKKFEEDLTVMAEHALTFKGKSKMSELYNYVAELQGLDKNIEEKNASIRQKKLNNMFLFHFLLIFPQHSLDC